MEKAFYAYSSQKPDLLEDIRTAVKEINKTTPEISISTWEDYSISGRYIIEGILKGIESCDLFMCDLTYLNYNVLYELGYAIGLGKKVWITLNSTHVRAAVNYKSLSLLSTIGYTGYQNSKELQNKFFSELPYLNTEPNIPIPDGNLERHLLYLKCEAATSASAELNERISKTQIPTKIDDTSEERRPLSWYLEVLPNAFGVIIHFHTLGSEKETPHDVARKALIAGLAKGMGKKTLLLCHSPFERPLDYHDELREHKNSNICAKIAREWLEPVIAEYRDMLEKHREYKTERKAANKLSSFMLGDYVAENENQDLIDYFIETAEFREALIAQQILFVGRKGTGKTANLINLRSKMLEDKRNFVVVIQPQGHEFEGVLSIMDQMSYSSEQGHFIESIWKFLIYTEIARQYYDYLNKQPLHIEKTEDEKQLIQFVINHQRVIDADFTLRLENIVSDLKAIDTYDSVEQQRTKISEYLHKSMLGNLRTHLGKVLRKRQNVKILIDNLDKGWNDSANLSSLGDLLFGLLSVVHKITGEFQRNDYRHVGVNLTLVVFLRSDIFSRIMSHAPERDKIATKHLNWSDPTLLFQVIEKRISFSSNGITSPSTFWRDYFTETVDGLPLKAYVKNLIIPRPRDIILLFKLALEEAVNNGHGIVEESDFKKAEYKYSEYALQSLFPENGKRVPDLEAILYEFVGRNAILSKPEVEECIKLNTSEDTDFIIQVLCEMTFLGLEISNDTFEYYNERRPEKITNKLAIRHSERTGQPIRYKINPAFYKYLDIIQTD
ncbi:P-loop ATPase, Sll1717 family [Paenibacillus lactis]|uniref:P-loop ATPase, Sll1717 family n=1 Tax=Paenibacillus lactis TaxID=228574 RepID=UPI0036BDEEF8